MNNQSGSLEAFLSPGRDGEHRESKRAEQNGGTHYMNDSSASSADGALMTLGRGSLQVNLSPAASTNRQVILPLRSWINHALKSVPDSDKSRPFLSKPYLQSCLKIAISLTEQILQADKLAGWGISNKLDVLPFHSFIDWTEHATVTVPSASTSCDDPGDEDTDRELNRQWEALLKEFPDESDDDEDAIHESFGEAMTKRSTGASYDAAAAMGISQNPDNQLDAAEAFDWNTGAMVGLENADAYYRKPSAAAAVNQDLNRQMEAFLETFGLSKSQDAESGKRSDNGARMASEQVVPQSSGIDYLNVNSAEVRCPENNNLNSYYSNASREKLQRIFHLAMLFYELFTGGQPPGSDLRALASLNGAFSSLPILALVEPRDVDDAGTPNQPKRHQGAEKQKGLCRLTFEYLKFMQIPGPLCHLIFNMLDCVHGELSGDECYNAICDIKSDLQLMLDKPKFLRGLETSICGLQLNEISISREEEIQYIVSCYHRCISGSFELAIVSGASGAGKSWILEKVGSTIIAGGGLFLMGKFDQQQQSKPFSALAAAFDQYVEVLISQVGSDWAKTVVRSLQTALGQDAYHLVEVMPRLGQLLDTVYGAAPNFGYDCRNAADRIHYLLCKFVEVISMTALVSLTLCLDDVQWIDNASSSVLKRVLAQKPNKFFFLGCCRDDEMEPDHPCTSMLREVDESGVNTTNVTVSCMKEEEINIFVSELFCLSPRLVEPLSRIIYSRTKGNILFVSQLLLSLNRDGLLQVDFGNQRYVWDVEQINSTKLPDNVALCFTNGIGKLPIEVQLSIHTLSMFGASARSDCIAFLESQLHVKISEPLQVAVKEGLVSSVKNSYTFCHDRIQEASYQMIAEHDRLCNHLTYGRCLMKFAHETGDDDVLFIAINQINSGGPSAITNPEEYFTMSQHNMHAGKRAMTKSNFHTAYKLFDNSISFLRKDNWKQHYAFSLELYELASRCALASGHLLQLPILTDHVLRHARSFEDQLNTHFIIMSSQERSPSTLSDALEKGLAIVRQLGEEIESNPSQNTFQEQFDLTIAITRDISPDIFLNYRPITDEKKLALMKFLERILVITFFTNHTLHSCVTLKMVQLVVSCGMCPESCTAFAFYGSLLVRRGEIELALYFTTLAKSLLGRFDNGKEGSGEVLLWVCEVKCFSEPYQATNEYHLEAEAEALSAGDIHYACFNRLLYCTNMFWSGVALSKVKEKVKDACMFMKNQLHRNALFFMLSVNSTLSVLMEGDTATESRKNWIRNAIGNNHSRLQLQIASHNLYLDFVFYHQDLKGCCDQFHQKELQSGCIIFHETIHSFIVGLASYQLYRETEDFFWYDRGKKRLDEIKFWADRGAAWNFSHKLSLLEAEDSFSLGDFDAAKQSYKNAITASEAHKFNNDLALSYELAAKFYLGIGELHTSLEHFTLAHKAYETWGAMGKAQKLFTFTNETFTSLITRCPDQTSYVAGNS